MLVCLIPLWNFHDLNCFTRTRSEQINPATTQALIANSRCWVGNSVGDIFYVPTCCKQDGLAEIAQNIPKRLIALQALNDHDLSQSGGYLTADFRQPAKLQEQIKKFSFPLFFWTNLP